LTVENRAAIFSGDSGTNKELSEELELYKAEGQPVPSSMPANGAGKIG